MAKVAIHPAVDNGVHIHAHAGFKGGTLVCKCKTDPVEVTVDSDYLFNHLCGCTQCWKPEGAAFSMLAAVPRETVKVTKNGQKLKIVDETKLLHRYACKDCGVHMYGVIEKADHVFHPFAFIHPERSRDEGYAAPTFAAFGDRGRRTADGHGVAARTAEGARDRALRLLFAGADGHRRQPRGQGQGHAGGVM